MMYAVDISYMWFSGLWSACCAALILHKLTGLQIKLSVDSCSPANCFMASILAHTIDINDHHVAGLSSFIRLRSVHFLHA